MTAAVFVREYRVPFSDCDPAGIMFFPHIFRCFQDLVETWITEALAIRYADLLGPRRVGLPSVRWESDFSRITRMGDVVTLHLIVERLGDRSLTLRLAMHGEDGVRVTARQVIVCTHLDTHTAMPFPDDLRSAIERFQEHAA